jgi:hypothetical protein
VRVDRLVVLVCASACAHAHAPPVAPADKVKLVMLPAESDAFPAIAKAATSAIAKARLAGVDEAVPSKVSMEVVQLSIECVDASASCYEAVAKSLAANKLLFASIDNEGKKPKVSITVFDVATRSPHAVQRTYDSEAAAIAGVDALVAEATR